MTSEKIKTLAKELRLKCMSDEDNIITVEASNGEKIVISYIKGIGIDVSFDSYSPFGVSAYSWEQVAR